MNIFCLHKVWPKFTPIKKKMFTQSLHCKNTVCLHSVYTRFTCHVQACKPRKNLVCNTPKPQSEDANVYTQSLVWKLHEPRKAVYRQFTLIFFSKFDWTLTEFIQSLLAISKHLNQNLKWPYLGNQSSVWDEPKNRFNNPSVIDKLC